MIDKTLIFLRDQLNEYITLKKGDSYQLKLTNLTNNKGEGADYNLGMSLVNVEEERKLKDQNYLRENSEGVKMRVNPQIKLNLYILFTAKFEKADGETVDIFPYSFEYLSLIVSFFQAHNHFNLQTSPTLPQELEKLLVDMHTLSFEQQNNLWGSLSSRYLPSLLYKVRLVSFQETNPQNAAILTTGLAPDLGGR